MTIRSDLAGDWEPVGWLDRSRAGLDVQGI